jgi:uncharacterized protein YjbI with pentapeptide repeats
MNLAGVCLDIADLYGADLERSDLTGVAAHIACLERANLRGAKLSGARLWRANLSNANLSEVELAQADLEQADLRGALYENVHLGTFRVRGALVSRVQPDAARKELSAHAKKQEEEHRRHMGEPEPADAPAENP